MNHPTSAGVLTKFVQIPPEWAYDVAPDGAIMIYDCLGGDVLAYFPPDPDQWLPALALAFCAITADGERLSRDIKQWAVHKEGVYRETRQAIEEEGKAVDG